MNTLECIKTRHSTRKFKSEPVAQEKKSMAKLK